MKQIWITGEKHRRTIELASAIPWIRLHEILADDVNPIVRYLCLLFRSGYLLLETLPKLVVVQNPSLVLTLVCLMLSKLLRFHLVVDAHNEGIIPFSRNRRWLLPVYHLIQRGADLTIVTNSELAKIVKRNGGIPFVLEDKIPEFPKPKKINLKGNRNVLFVCTFEKDEPYAEVINAATLIDPSIFIYITGSYRRAPIQVVQHAPSNVVFTDFIPDQDYVNLFYSCDAIIDLTLMEDCLVCGAYEAVALGKPLILSDTRSLRNYFSIGAVFTKNTDREIASAIEHTLQNTDTLTNEISALRADLIVGWDKNFTKLIHKLNELITS